MKWIPVAALLLLAGSCKKGDGYNKFLETCNIVQIVVYNGGDSLHFDTKDTTGVKLLANQVSGNTNTLKDTCAAEGVMRYLKDSTLLLEARFAAADCQYLTYTHGGYTYVHRLTERGENLLQTIMQEAKK